MLFVDNQNMVDPRTNLALEEHLLRNVQEAEPMLLFYVNEPSVIIGRNQNTLEEIDPDYVEDNDIHLVRRLSGGGAVYHDLGNLNFSFITPGRENLHNFAKFTEPVIAVLRGLGLDAELRGKSDIFAGGKKISGNAQYSTQKRMFSHGTLLFDTDLEVMLKAINPRQVKIESKAVQSVRNFVTNIRELLPEEMDIYQFKEKLLRGIFGGDEIPTFQLTDSDWAQVAQLRQERYGNWEWNIGRSPDFNVQKSERFDGVGKVDVRIDVAQGRIQAVKLYGDFSGRREVGELEARLEGVRYERAALDAALVDVDVGAYVANLGRESLLTLIY